MTCQKRKNGYAKFPLRVGLNAGRRALDSPLFGAFELCRDRSRLFLLVGGRLDAGAAKSTLRVGVKRVASASESHSAYVGFPSSDSIVIAGKPSFLP